MTPDESDYRYDAFISYNRADEEWAEKLATMLEKEEWRGRKLKVFFAPWDIKPGESILERLEEALPKSRKVCLIMSPGSEQSEWVRAERYIAQHLDITEREKRLIPLYLRDCEIPPFLQHINRLDFRDESKFAEGYGLLLATIKDEPLPRGGQAPSTAAVVSTPAQIPRPPFVGFVARRDEQGRELLARLKAELAPEKGQLVVLSGPGGVGKTTLAAEAARSLAHLFQHRVVWIRAIGREDFKLSTLLDEILMQLGRADLCTLPPAQKEAHVRALVSAQPALVVLDNFETIKQPEQARCVEFLSEGTSCPALITTRQKINGARNIVIPAMSREEADEYLSLLIEQADNASAFDGLDRERIMQLSERNPLVLQWVVAQINLAQEAETVLDELLHGEGDAAERVFDRSFNLEQVGADGRDVLLALSLFVPDAARVMLAGVAGFGADEDRLNAAVKNLAALFLVKPAPKGRLVVEGLTRELARSRLRREPRGGEFIRRFADTLMHHARAHDKPTPEDYDALEAELDNLLAAMDIAFISNAWQYVHDFAIALAVPLRGVLYVHGHWDEAVRRNEQALKMMRSLQNESKVAGFAHSAAVMYQYRGQLEEARRLYTESLEIASRLGEQRSIFIALHALGWLAHEQGNREEARRLYTESLEIARRLGDQGDIARVLHHLGWLMTDEGDWEEARRLFNESLEIKRKLNDPSSLANTLHQKGRLEEEQGNLEEARRLYTESLEIKKRLGDQVGIASASSQLGALAEQKGNKSEAARLYREALTIFERLGSPFAEDIRLNLERLEREAS